MAFFSSRWNEEVDYNYNNKSIITKDDVIVYLKGHPELLDELILLMRKEKVKKIKNVLGMEDNRNI